MDNEQLTAGQKAAATRRANREARERTLAAEVTAAINIRVEGERTVPVRADVDNPFNVGDRVVIRRHSTKKYEGEPGRILNFCGSVDAPYAVVLTCGVSPLVPVENLERDDA